MRFSAGLRLCLTLLATAAIGKEPASDLPPRDPATGRFVYQEIVPVQDVKAAELYSRARAWVASSYRSTKDVVQLEDKDAGRLIVRGTQGLTYLTTYVTVEHTLTIEVKDGRYRYILTDFFYEGTPPGILHWPLENTKGMIRWGKFQARVGERCEALLTDLKSAMAQNSDKGSNAW